MECNFQFKRGLKSNLPSSAPNGMPLWCEDTGELYIGTEDGVKKVCANIDLTYTQHAENIFPLKDNCVHSISIIGNINFILPLPAELYAFHQILVQLNMNNGVYAIDLGAENFFGNQIPDLSKEGSYDIIYEFNTEEEAWYCGVIKKKVSE